MVKHVERRGRGGRDVRIMHPYRDWKIVQGVCLVVLVGVLTYVYFIHQYYSNVGDTVEAEYKETVEYDTVSAEQVLEYYQNKSKRLKALLDTYVTPPVPEVTTEEENEEGELEINDVSLST